MHAIIVTSVDSFNQYPVPHGWAHGTFYCNCSCVLDQKPLFLMQYDCSFCMVKLNWSNLKMKHWNRARDIHNKALKIKITLIQLPYVYINTCIYTHTCVHTHIYTHIYKHTYLYVCVYISVVAIICNIMSCSAVSRVL